MVLLARLISPAMRSRCLPTLRGRGGVATKVLAQQEQRRLHHRQRVAQLVADAGRELTDGGQALGVAVLDQQILAVGLEHDRELQVQDLVQRGGDPLRRGRVVAQPLAHHVQQVHADAVQGREHERLRQRDAHMHAPDPRAQLVIRLVVRAQQQDVQPADQGLLQPFDLGGAARDGGARLRVSFDRRVEVIHDRDESRLRDRMKFAQGRR